MDIKKRTKNIKLKLKELGYDVKHTHCKEVLAVAHGFRNSHHLNGKSNLSEAMDTLLPKSTYITIGLQAHTSNEFYCEQIMGVKAQLNQKQINDLIEARDFIKDRDLSIELDNDSIIPFSGFDEEHFQKKTKINECLSFDEENYPLDNFDVFEYLNDENYISSKEFYLSSNSFNYEGESKSSIKATKYGISFITIISDKHQDVMFSSNDITWDEINLENKLE